MTVLSELLRAWLPEQRWFGGKGRELTAVRTQAIPLSAQPLVELHVVDVDYGDGGAESYLVPLSRRDPPVDGLESALIGELPDPPRFGYDAMRDRDVTPLWLELFSAGHEESGVRFEAEPGAALPDHLPGDIISTEQSNSSLVFGEDAILKLFRRMEPGRNPDVEIHHALRRRDNPHVAPLLGSVSLRRTADAEESTVAMLQTKWVAISRASPSGSARRPPPCTPTWPRCCPPRRWTPGSSAPPPRR